MRSLVTDDGSRTLYSPCFEQTYRSHRGAHSEASWVFLTGSGVATALDAGKGRAVLEVGFGTGLNFLVTAAAAHAAGAPLRYLALERDLPPVEMLAELDYASLLAPSSLPGELLTWLADLEAAGTPAGEHVFEPASAPQVQLALNIGDALDFGADGRDTGAFDAIYLDAFSPQVNPELWQPDFLARLAGALAPGGRLVSYSVNGAVRRSLTAAGLEVRKVAGPPGGMREVLQAHRPEP